MQNCSSINLSGDCSGAVNTGSPNFTFANFPNAAQPSNNRYFQYRVLMEAEDNTACDGDPCLPDLASVAVGPTGRYFAGSPSVVDKSDKAVAKVSLM